MSLVFPTAAEAALQTPIYTFSPTSTPLVNTTNSNTYTYDPALGVWTAAGVGGTGFPPGTKIVFAQAAAPSGWVQVTDATHENASIRLVTSAGAGTGGSATFTDTFAASRSVPLLQHSHTATTTGSISGGPYAYAFGSSGRQSGGANVVQDYYLSSPTLSGLSTSVGNAGTSGATMDFAVKYVDMIVATKS